MHPRSHTCCFVVFKVSVQSPCGTHNTFPHVSYCCCFCFQLFGSPVKQKSSAEHLFRPKFQKVQVLPSSSPLSVSLLGSCHTGGGGYQESRSPLFCLFKCSLLKDVWIKWRREQRQVWDVVKEESVCELLVLFFKNKKNVLYNLCNCPSVPTTLKTYKSNLQCILCNLILCYTRPV